MDPEVWDGTVSIAEINVATPMGSDKGSDKEASESVGQKLSYDFGAWNLAAGVIELDDSSTESMPGTESMSCTTESMPEVCTYLVVRVLLVGRWSTCCYGNGMCCF